MSDVGHHCPQCGEAGHEGIMAVGQTMAGKVHIAVAVMLLVWPLSVAQSAEPNWPPGPYKYMVIDQDIKDALIEYGRNIRIPVKVSNRVGGQRLRGRFPVGTAKEFLERLCFSYGLVWYFDGLVLHVGAESELRTELLDLGRLPASGVMGRLEKRGVIDSRYPIETTADPTILSVSGPPAYVSRVQQVLASMKRAQVPLWARERTPGDYSSIRVFRGGGGS